MSHSRRRRHRQQTPSPLDPVPNGELRLNLSASRVKLARAFQHLEALKRETAALADTNPFVIRTTEIDQDSGWASIYVGLNKFEEPDIGPIVGDLMHNLRCALDYIVTALAHASETPLTDRHQFPIYTSERQFRKYVLSERWEPVVRGPLHGLKHGLREIYRAQPFCEQPNPPEFNPLFVLNAFSNADKHRLLTKAYGGVSSVKLMVGPSDGVTDALEIVAARPPDPFFEGEFELVRLRYAVPCSHEVAIPEGALQWHVRFMAELIGKPGDYADSGLVGIEAVVKHVSNVVETFAAL